MIIILHNSHFQILYLARTTLEDFSVLCEKRGRQPKYITPSDHQRLHKRRVETKQKLMQIKTRFGTPSPIIHYPLTPASAELAELMLRGSLSLALLRLSIFPYFYISYFYIYPFRARAEPPYRHPQPPSHGTLPTIPVRSKPGQLALLVSSFPCLYPQPDLCFFFFAISVRFPNHFYFAS